MSTIVQKWLESVNEERATLQDSKFLINTIKIWTWDEITLIYFSKIPPLLLLGIITTMSGSSTFASWNIQATLRKDPALNFLPPPSFPVSETAALVCQAQPACDESSTISIILSHLLWSSSCTWRRKCPLRLCLAAQWSASSNVSSPFHSKWCICISSMPNLLMRGQKSLGTS